MYVFAFVQLGILINDAHKSRPFPLNRHAFECASLCERSLVSFNYIFTNFLKRKKTKLVLVNIPSPFV